MKHLVLVFLVACAAGAETGPDTHVPVAASEPTEPVAGYLSSDQTTADRIAEILATHGIEEIAVGSLGTTVNTPVSRAAEARALISDAITREHLRADIYK